MVRNTAVAQHPAVKLFRGSNLMYSPARERPSFQGVQQMKRLHRTLAAVVLVLSAALAHAQAADFSRVEIKATKVNDKF